MEPPLKHRGRPRDIVENEIIKRREKEYKYNQMWGGLENYYKHWEKTNTKFDEWTSPRYYEDNTKLLSEVRAKKDKEELLIKRREKLTKLLFEEERSYSIEMMVHQTKKAPVKTRIDDIPTEVLKDVNVGLKLKEEERRRREAELKLYHQWRQNNPVVRQLESKYRFKDLKLSWLDQQIEKRMQKEKEEEECRKILKDREEQLRLEKEKEEAFKKEVEEKRKKLKEGLDRQVKELLEKQRLSDELRKKEAEEVKRKCEIEELEEQRLLEEKRRKDREFALYNIRHHKLRLKQRAVEVEETLLQEKEFIVRLRKLELEDVLQDELKKQEIKNQMERFLQLVNEHRELMREREKYLDFIFDSQAKNAYDEQTEQWKREEMARKRLLENVLSTVKKQVEENIEKNRTRQIELLREREELIKSSEEYDRELERLKKEEVRKKLERKKAIEEDIKVKQARKKQQENLKLKEIEDDLERVRKEEERLQKEIMEMQRRHNPVVRPSSSCGPRRFF